MGEYKRIGEIFMQSSKFTYQCYCCEEFFEDLKLLEQHILVSSLQEPTCETGEELDVIETDVQESTHEETVSLAEEIIVEEVTDDFVDDLESKVDLIEDLNVMDYAHFNEEYTVDNIIADEKKTPYQSQNLMYDNNEYFDNNVQKEIELEILEEDTASNKSLNDVLAESDVDNHSMQEALRRLKAIRKSKASPKTKPLTQENVHCTQCDFVTTKHSLLKIHNDHEHTYTKCHICGLTIKSKQYFQVHIKRHSEVKRFCCSYCGMRFFTNTRLKSHERVHTQEKPFKCENCGKRFISSSQLYNHHLTESKVRPYHCELCEYSGRTKYQLQRHMVTHTKEKNIACEHCDAKFPRREAYRLHLKLHINAKEYSCDYCPMAFNQKQALIAHLRGKHQIEKRKSQQQNEL